MAHFIGLGRFTDQGAKNIKDYPKTVEEGIKSFPPGIKVNGFYITQGQYDAVVVFEAPDNEAALALVAEICARGNTRWETLPAVTIERFGQLISR